MCVQLLLISSFKPFGAPAAWLNSSFPEWRLFWDTSWIGESLRPEKEQPKVVSLAQSATATLGH